MRANAVSIATIAEVPGLSMSAISIAPTGSIPWRFRHKSDERLISMSGELSVLHGNPVQEQVLRAGDELLITAGTPSFCRPCNGTEVRLLSLQGVGPPSFSWISDSVQEPEGHLTGSVQADASSILCSAVARTKRDGPEDAWKNYSEGAVSWDLVAAAENLRVLRMGLGAWHCRPWHWHSEVTDTFVCLSGHLRVMTSKPTVSYILTPGETISVPPKIPHFVSGVEGAPTKAMLMQGIGTYDRHPPYPFDPFIKYADLHDRTN